ncbi:MAG: MFS transporter [Chromatiales bacterium]|nr:MAG: MFS transporter [Chromatiales bacterium]
MNFTPDPAGLKVGPFWIRPGITRGNVATVIFASFLAISMTVFLSLIQPYVLNAIVKIPEARQGSVTGSLVAMSEAIAVLLLGFIGAWADRVGRRIVFCTGFTLLAAGYLIYPLATSETQLYLFRIVFAVGLASVPVMLSITVQDTPQEVSRGKWVALNNICQGIGILVIATFLLGRSPAWFQSAGMDPVMAGRLALWSAAGLCLVAAAVLWRGLPRATHVTQRKVELLPQFLDGLRAGVANPRLATAFGAAFISRGDMVVVGNFLTLWVTQYGIERGLDTAAASGRAFMLFGIVQISALAWAGVMGVLADRMNRVTSLCVALGLATAGYGLMGQVDDPLARSTIPVAVLLGMGEVSMIVAGGALLGQEARASLRGTIVGVFNLFGALGIVAVSFVGGLVFDSLGRSMPFTMMGLLNGLLLIVALAVRMRAGTPAPAGATAD